MLKKLRTWFSSILKSRTFQNWVDDIRSLSCGFDLNALGKIYKTDKIEGHFYTAHYMAHFGKFKYRKLNLLEVGVGGYDNPNLGGNSLRMWKRYFPFGKIYGLDIYDKSKLQENRIEIFKGSQADKKFLTEVTRKTGALDIIIDDGSHINKHTIKTFQILFPQLKDGGIYVIEDTQTSYWKNFGGTSKDLNDPSTMLNYFKRLTDSLNNQEFFIKNYKQTYFDKKIVSMHFYHNLLFIYKGTNDEKSNLVIDNCRFKAQ